MGCLVRALGMERPLRGLETKEEFDLLSPLHLPGLWFLLTLSPGSLRSQGHLGALVFSELRAGCAWRLGTWAAS